MVELQGEIDDSLLCVTFSLRVTGALQREWLRNGRRIHREVDSWLGMVGEGLNDGFISSTAVILLVELVVKLVVVQMTDSMWSKGRPLRYSLCSSLAHTG